MAKIGDVIDAENARWTFANKTRTQFEQHIEKSVPFYDEGHSIALGLSDFNFNKKQRLLRHWVFNCHFVEKFGRTP